MPEIGVIVFDRCTTHAGTAALIDERCYPLRLPKKPTYPAITYVAPVSEDDSLYRTHDTVPTRAVVRVQLNCYDSTRDGAKALADQIRSAWSGYNDACDVGYAFIANRISTREDAIDAYRVIVDVIIEYQL